MKTIGILAVLLGVVAVFLMADIPGASGQSACEPYADAVVSYNPGPDVGSPHDDPSNGLGPPDQLWVSLGYGGAIVLEFVDNVAVDGPGPDIRVAEVQSGHMETAIVEASLDGSAFVTLGTVNWAGDLDLAGTGLSYVAFVRITDAQEGITGMPVGGFDLDFIEALNCETSAPTPTPTPTPTPPAAVGGIVEMQVGRSGSAVDSVAGSSGGSSVGYYIALAGAAAVGAIAVTAGALYAKRRWVR